MNMAESGTRRIDYFWADAFGIDIAEFVQAGINVVEYASAKAFIYRDDVRCIVAVDSSTVSEIQKKVDLQTDHGLDEIGIRSLLNQVCDLGQRERAFHAFLDEQKLGKYEKHNARPLHGTDRSAIAAMELECPMPEWSSSSISCLRQHVFGVFSGRELVAIGYHSPVFPYATAIGVITHPGHRGRGYGKAVVGMATEHALELGYLVRYQTSSKNLASRSLSLSLGF